jgi:hypothetical protein
MNALGLYHPQILAGQEMVVSSAPLRIDFWPTRLVVAMPTPFQVLKVTIGEREVFAAEGAIPAEAFAEIPGRLYWGGVLRGEQIALTVLAESSATFRAAIFGYTEDDAPETSISRSLARIVAGAE